MKDNFFDKVYELVKQIPYGRVTTYGDIAKHIGSGKSSRMVGWAMNSSHSIYPPIPAHRVVNRNGMLTGKNHFASPNLMQQLLENEGVKIENDTVLDFENVRWIP